jgi:hypothetical protein
MYFDHSKRSYYRFPNKNSVTDIDKQMPYYFPEKNSLNTDDFSGGYIDSNYNNYDDIHEYSKGSTY